MATAVATCEVVARWQRVIASSHGRIAARGRAASARRATGSTTPEDHSGRRTRGPGSSREAVTGARSSMRSSTSSVAQLLEASRRPRSRPRCAVRRRSAGRGRAASTGRSWSWRGGSGSSRAAPCVGRSALAMDETTSERCSAASDSASRRAYSRTTSASCSPDSGAYSCRPLLPLVTGTHSRPSAASRSRTSSATSAHSGRPGRRAGVEVDDEPVRVALAAARADRPLRHVQLQRGQVGQPDQRGQAVDDAGR